VSGAVDVGSWVVAVVIVASSVLTLVYFLRVLELMWFRAPADADADDDAGDDARDDAPPVTEAGPSIVVPIGVLAAAVVVLGLVNLVIVEQVLDPVAARLLP
jgi:multicomponent Na+:H+ antiporter subunit D